LSVTSRIFFCETFWSAGGLLFRRIIKEEMDSSVFEQETQVLDDLVIESPEPVMMKRKFIETQLLDLANSDPSLPSKSIADWVIDTVREHLVPSNEELDPLQEKQRIRKLRRLVEAKKEKRNLIRTIEQIETMQSSTNKVLITHRNQLLSLDTKIKNIELEIKSRSV
jgi:hypothetical protein